MSCKDCQEAQRGEWSAFYRWGTANIELRGCTKHLREVVEILNKIQKENVKEIKDEKF